MGFLSIFKRRLKPEEVIQKILEYVPEEDLKILNSCENSNFEIALICEFCKAPLRFKFKKFEDAIPGINEVLEASRLCSLPISEKELNFFCWALKRGMFKEL